MLYIHRYLRFDFEVILYIINKRNLMIETKIIIIDSLELMLIWYSSWLQFIDTWNMVLCIIKVFIIVQNVENLPGGNYCTLIISLLITRVMYVFKKNDIYLKNVACRQNFFLKVYWSNLVPGEWHAIFSFHSTIGLHSLEMEHCWIDYIRFLQPYNAHVSLKYIKKVVKNNFRSVNIGICHCTISVTLPLCLASQSINYTPRSCLPAWNWFLLPRGYPTSRGCRLYGVGIYQAMEPLFALHCWCFAWISFTYH